MSTTPAFRAALVPLGRLQLLTRLPKTNHREVTLYIKGFLAEGENPKDFHAWLTSHQLLALSPKHNWDGLSFGYSWHSGIFPHISTVPVPVATLGTVAARLLSLRKLTPVGLATSLAVDAALNLGKLAVQFAGAAQRSADGAPHLAETLLNLRREYDHVRVVAHSLGCRHLCHALALLDPNDRPDTVHFCAPAMTNAVFRRAHERGGFEPDAESNPNDARQWGDLHADPPLLPPVIPLARRAEYVYWTPHDVVLGTLFRAANVGSAALGHVGIVPPIPDPPLTPAQVVRHADGSQVVARPHVGANDDVMHGGMVAHPWVRAPLKIEAVDVSDFFGRSPVRAVHTGYAAGFHFFAREYWGGVADGEAE
ncbi:hypothetical protein GGF32_009890 [Allomyces javanicus]|nr:hypothetical protein GGF32_009890 [Allomyces javanicus]